MSDWIDITLPMTNTLPPWPGDTPFRREATGAIRADGSGANVSALSMSSHSGTHVDAPRHFIAGGAFVDELDPDTLVGPAFVLDLSALGSHIAARDLAGRIPEGVKRLLIRTRNSARIRDGVFHTDFIALTRDAALSAAASGVRLLGLDYYSIEPYHSGEGTHTAFLSIPGAIALENIDLSGAEEGWYDLVCLPLRIADGDGSPARALIRKRGAKG